METKRCPHCGETLPRSSTFCPACFKELTIETAEPVVVSKKKNMLFLWLGLLFLVILFFIFFCVFSQRQETNGTPTTFTPSPLSEGTASVDTAVPELTPGTNMPFDTNVPSAANTQTQFMESVTDTPIATTNVPTTETPSFSFQIPTFFPLFTNSATTGTPAANTPTATSNRNTATATASTPTKSVTTTGSKTPTQTKATATNKTTTTVKPTATAKPAATPTPVIDQRLFAYTISDGKATITKYYGSDAVVYIPETLGGYPVTKIGDEAFSNQNTLLEVYLPDTIVEIGIHAFSFCYNLQKVQLSENLKKISDNAFYCCVNLSAISLPDTLEYMGPGSFTESGLDEIKIPAAVTQLEAALYSMHYLDYIEVEKGNSKYWSQDGVLFQNIDDGTSMLLKYPAEKEGRSYTIPDNVSIIDGEAFRGNQSLEILTFSKQLTTVYSNAFFMCSSLTTVKTYGNLQTVYYGAFYRCTNLTSINLESSVTYIGEDVFAYCDNPTLTVTKGSYAHTFAEENNIPYILK